MKYCEVKSKKILSPIILKWIWSCVFKWALWKSEAGV